MDLFTTKIPLSNTINTKKIWSIIENWLLNSPHYFIREINYSFEEECVINTSESTKLSILNTSIAKEKFFAIRFENTESKVIWKTDCVFNEQSNELLIQLSCESKQYTTKLPKIHKPYIIKSLFDENLIATTETYPISDKPIYLSSENDLQKCTDIMTGKNITYLPVVYVSINMFDTPKYTINPNTLAIKLSGIAHVLVEPDREFSNLLRSQCCENNAYNGYIGIYFPGTSFKEIISYKDYFKNGKIDSIALMDAVRYAVQQAALNHSNTHDWTWDRLLAEYSKQKFLNQLKITDSTQNELTEFIKYFDEETKILKAKIERLTQQLDSKTAQLESIKQKYNINGTINLNCSLDEFFIDEHLDCVLNILEQVQKKLNEETRMFEIINNILSVNKPSNHGKIIFKQIEKAITEKSTTKRRALLSDCGFTVEKGSHDKIIYHSNKYWFTLSNSPSDYRGANNLLLKIINTIDVYRKIF